MCVSNKGDHGTCFCRDMAEMMIIWAGEGLCEGETCVNLSMNEGTVGRRD